MLQGKYVFFAHYYGTLSCEKQSKDEYKRFLLIIVLHFIISFLQYAYNHEEKFYTGRGGVESIMWPQNRL